VPGRVVKLAAGSNTQTVLPFTDLQGPVAVGVDTTLDTSQQSGRVLKSSAGSSTQTVLPFTGLQDPAGVAVDTAGNLYVVDQNKRRVLKLAAGSDTQTVLPFTGLRLPAGCGGGHRRQRLRHRPGHPTRGGVAGGMMSLPTMGA
jgi:serine/threonine protein kinase, bacterial